MSAPNADPPLQAFLLSADYERAIQMTLQPGPPGIEVVNSTIGYMLVAHLELATSRRDDPKFRPLLLLPPRLAIAVRPILERAAPHIAVRGYDTIPVGAQVECVEEIQLPNPPHDMPPNPAYPPPVHVRPEDMGDAKDWTW